MRTNLLLTKALAVVALLLGGVSSVWADQVVLSPTADAWLDYKSTGNKDANYGSATSLTVGVWQDMWTNGVPGLKNNNYGAFAIMKFDVSAYKGKITAASFKITATLGVSNNNRDLYIGYYTGTNWEEASITANNSGISHRSATDLNIGHLGTFATIAKNATAEYTCSNLSALVDYLNNDADGIVSLIFYTYTVDISIASKEATAGQPSLTLSYTNSTLYSATFTEANELTPTVTIYSDPERNTVVPNGTLSNGTKYYYRATLVGYHDYDGEFTVSDSDPKINFAMVAKTQYTYNVYAVNESSEKLQDDPIATATVYEGETATVSWSNFIQNGGQWYVSTESSFYATATEAGSRNVVYAASDISYFFEMENLSRSGGAYLTEEDASYSGGKRLRLSKSSLYYTPALSTGIYTISIPWVNSNNSEAEVYVYTRSATGDLSEKLATFTAPKGSGTFTATIVVPEGYSIAFNGNEGSNNNNARMDYMTLKAITSVSATIGANGFTTFASAYPLDLANLPGGLTAYTATLSGATIKFAECTQAVAAGTGLLLEGTAGETYDIPVVAEGATVSDNALTGVTAVTPLKSDTENYIFAMRKATSANDPLSFAPLTSESEVNFPAGKAYIEVPASAFNGNVEARALVLTFDDATSIRSVDSRQLTVDSYYNLNGQRVSQPSKGLYIVNGKKVVIK